MIPIDLQGRKALITGGNTGLGAAASLALAQAGADIAIAWRSRPETAEEIAGKAAGLGVTALPVHLADIADEAEVARLFGWIDDEFGGIDILVNNAGTDGPRAPAATIDPADWKRVVEVDLVGAFHCAHHAVARMVKKGRGVIVNTTSVHEFIPWAGYSAYTSAKAGLGMFTKTLAQEVADKGVRVVGIAPGAIRTPINSNVWSDPKGLADLNAKIPMGRMGEPGEIGQVIAFLCCDLAGYITGTTIAVDGGMLLYPDFRHGG
jgi:glucose 1-dehydrogenase